ncbi:MAG: glycerol kinase [Planctomycetes bacterium SM23_25]|nr:MAG: glycerol kinase [Planctomycetes bacterium SM23_25]
MAMKKFMNDPENLVSELLEGYALLHAGKIRVAENNLVVRAKPKDKGKVGIVTLGGSGHEPALSGFVGFGMIDISVAGEIFAAPGAPACLEALKLADRGAGVLFVVLNHPGDVLSANLTMKMAAKEGLNVKQLLTHEDIAGGPRSDPEQRRGLVGCIPVYKLVGAAAEAGKSLDEVYAIGEAYERNMATLAVAVTSATHPATGEAMFELPDDEMEIGMGQHGEAGTGRTQLKTADETAETMLDMLLRDLAVRPGEQLLVMVNGSGATTLMELYIIFRRVHQVLSQKGIQVACSRVAEDLTVQEMAGFQMHIGRVTDEMVHLWNAPCDTPFMTVR